MRISLFSAFVIASACALSSSPRAQLSLNEILIDPVGPNAGAQIVEIVNDSGAPFTPTGWFICAPFVYSAMPSISIPAGGFVQMHIGASGTDTATDFFFPSMRSLNTSDTFQLYSSGCFSCSNDIVDFASWGGGTARIRQAVAVNQWPSNTATIPGPTAEGQTLAWVGRGDGPSDWFRDASPTLGADNGNPTVTALGTGCATSAGIPSVGSSTLAVDGNIDHQFTISGGTPNAPALMLIGFTASGGIPFLGCSIEVGIVSSIATMLDGSGSGAVPLPLNSSMAGALTGVNVFIQAAVVDAGAPNGLYGISPGASIVIG